MAACIILETPLIQETHSKFKKKKSWSNLIYNERFSSIFKEYAYYICFVGTVTYFPLYMKGGEFKKNAISLIVDISVCMLLYTCACTTAVLCFRAHGEVHHGHRCLRCKRLKKGNINHKAVGERKAEIRRGCAGKRGEIIGSCGLCLRQCTWSDTVCRLGWIWLAE